MMTGVDIGYLKTGAVNFVNDVLDANSNVSIGLVSFATIGDDQQDFAEDKIGLANSLFDFPESTQMQMIQNIPYFAKRNILSISDLIAICNADIQQGEDIKNRVPEKAKVHNGLTKDKDNLINSINSLYPCGKRCIWSGVELAIPKFTTDSDVPKTILLFTTGEQDCEDHSHLWTSEYLESIIDSGIDIKPIVLRGGFTN